MTIFVFTAIQSMIGSLDYLIISTRSDLAFAVRISSTFNSRPNAVYKAMATQDLRYTQATKSRRLLYRSSSFRVY